MHPDISEFSYGYALTETMVSSASTPLRVADDLGYSYVPADQVLAA